MNLQVNNTSKLAHRALQLNTKWFSHHSTLEKLVGGMLILHTIPLFLGKTLHTAKYLCGEKKNTGKKPYSARL